MERMFSLNSDKVSLREIEVKGEKKYVIEGYISTGDKDLVNDIVTKNCMEDMFKQLKTKNLKLDVEHESYRGNNDFEVEANKTIIPIGKVVDSTIDSKGLKVQAEINPHHTRFQEVWGSLKDGYLDAFSIAYIPVKTEKIMKDGQEVRMLNQINLLNTAVTGNPINPSASMTNVMAKSLDWIKEQEDKAQAQKPKYDIAKESEKEESEDEKKKKEEEESEEDKSFNCECLKCGHKVKSDDHCKELKCPKCGGEMRRLERPGPGTESKDKSLTESRSSNNGDNIKKMKGGLKMEKEQKNIEEDKKEEVAKVEEVKVEEKPEAKAEVKSETETTTTNEVTDSKINAEVKALREELKELKAVLEAPQHKAMMTNIKDVPEVKARSLSPLDLF